MSEQTRSKSPDDIVCPVSFELESLPTYECEYSAQYESERHGLHDPPMPYL
jgi:hypothetical protein